MMSPLQALAMGVALSASIIVIGFVVCWVQMYLDGRPARPPKPLPTPQQQAAREAAVVGFFATLAAQQAIKGAILQANQAQYRHDHRFYGPNGSNPNNY